MKSIFWSILDQNIIIIFINYNNLVLKFKIYNDDLIFWHDDDKIL